MDPRRPVRFRIGLAALALIGLGLATAAEPVAAQAAADSVSSRQDGRPLFRTSDLIYAGLFLGSLAAIYASPGVDESLSPEDPPDGIPGALFDGGEALGNGVLVFGAAFATWGIGELTGGEQVARIGLRSLEALVLATFLVVPTKAIVGRTRPDFDSSSDHFDSFSFTSARWSFPSGHSAATFAVASTLDRELRHQAPWVPWVAYSTAAFVGMSRVVGEKHWVTDIISGSAIGLFSGHIIGRLHGEEDIGIRPTPIVAAGPDEIRLGVRLVVR